MDLFDKERRMQHMFDAFQKTDAFYDAFKKEFSEALSLIIETYYPEVSKREAIRTLMLTYGQEILSATESVIDKDRNYPDYRKEEEHQIMKNLVEKPLDAEMNLAFVDAIHMKAKELIVNHYPDILELSRFGFLLLENNAKMYNRHFVAAFYMQLKIDAAQGL